MTSYSPGTNPAGAAHTVSPERPGATGTTGDAGQTIPLTGRQYELSAGDYHAVITELGAGLRELSYCGEPVISGYQADELPPAGAGQLLVPWPNRVDHGRYTFGGAEYHLDLSEAARGNAIHGLTRWAAWVAVVHEADRVLLKHVPHGYPGYPFGVEIDAEYRLTPTTGLQVTVTAANRGSRPAPYGTGQHPYLTVGAPAVDECELTLPAARWLPTDDRGIPSGPAQDIDGTPYDFRRPRVIGDTRLDHALTGLERGADGRAWVHLRSGSGQVALWAGEGYRWLQVFTGDTLGEDRRRKALAVEPMTCPPNAFVSGDDLIVLQPGERISHSWGIQAG
ncbi:MAG TPA: aldose 1-epimerase family protein [Streptosporangiaceae bacterium]|nr:aldose 1-epimerase family protein [Streptosporangiaceae bacterium]